MIEFYKLPKVALIACGGTIGGEWSPAADTVVPSKHGNKRLFEYLEQAARLHRKLVTIDLFNKDSRAVTDKDRERIVRKIIQLRKKGVRYFLITHGTFTLQQTGLYLVKKLESAGITDVYIALVASMIPNSGFAPSDAQFNIGFALAKLTSLPQEDTGVWLAMNGLFGRPNRITKNVGAAKFEIVKA